MQLYGVIIHMVVDISVEIQILLGDLLQVDINSLVQLYKVEKVM